MLTELKPSWRTPKPASRRRGRSFRNHAGWRRKRPIRRWITGDPIAQRHRQHAAPTTCRGVIINALLLAIISMIRLSSSVALKDTPDEQIEIDYPTLRAPQPLVSGHRRIIQRHQYGFPRRRRAGRDFIAQLFADAPSQPIPPISPIGAR